jgi:hypothetical protein
VSPDQFSRKLMPKEERLINDLLQRSPERLVLLDQLAGARVTERGGDGWVIEFHLPSYRRPQSTALKIVAEGYFERPDGSVEASVALFLDENGKLFELELFNYAEDAVRPYPDLRHLRVD